MVLMADVSRESTQASCDPLLSTSRDTTRRFEDRGSIAEERAHAVAQALAVLEEQLDTLRRGHATSTSATSELLRDTCQTLTDLAVRLHNVWSRAYPGEPEPLWDIEQIPCEELARIGWDLHANRVQLRNTGVSLWESVAYLLSGDQSTSFAKPPSAPQVEKALERAAARLGGSSPVPCH